MLEHPMISQINKTGYPENMAEQPEFAGSDVFGDEILEGDEIAITEDGEIILKDNLERYLAEAYGFRFAQAE